MESEYADYTVYLYDLPKAEYSSHKLARMMSELVGIELDRPPTVLKEGEK